MATKKDTPTFAKKELPDEEKPKNKTTKKKPTNKTVKKKESAKKAPAKKTTKKKPTKKKTKKVVDKAEKALASIEAEEAKIADMSAEAEAVIDPQDETNAEAATEEVVEEEIEEEIDEAVEEDDDQEEEGEEDEIVEEEEELDEEDDDEVVVSEKMSKKDIDSDLRDIYTDEQGDMPDMSQFAKKKRGGLLRAIIILLISLSFLAAVAWFGFFTFEPQARFSEQDVIVSISASETIAIGDEVRYRIKFQNDQQVPLTQSTIMVRYPAGFIFESSSIPANNEANDSWDIGAIGGRDGDMLEISGRLYGDIESEQSLRVFFNYTPSNFSSEFQKVEHARTTFESSPVSVAVEGPDAVVTNVPDSWVFTVSESEEPVTFEVILPDNFQMKDAAPAADTASPRKWTIAPDAEDRTITVNGLFNAVTDEPSIIQGSLTATVENEDNDVTYKLAVVDAPVTVSDTAISVSMLVNGAYGDFSLLAGDPLNTSIFVRNNSEDTMEDVSVRFVVDSPSDGKKTIFAWAQILDEYDGDIFGEQKDEDTRRATLTWESADIAELASIAPGEEVVINFSLPILDAVDIDLTTFAAAAAAANTEVQYSVDDSRENMSTDVANIMINSDLSFDPIQKITSESDGAELYELTFALKNNFHALTDISLDMDVYGDVIVEILDIPAGEAAYDADASQLTWSISEMPIGIDVLPLQFSIRLIDKNPTQTNLTSKVRIQATDSVTGERITIVGSEILLPTAEEGSDIQA